MNTTRYQAASVNPYPYPVVLVADRDTQSHS